MKRCCKRWVDSHRTWSSQRGQVNEHFPHLLTQSYRRDMAQLAKGEWKSKTEKKTPRGPRIQIEVSWEFFVWLIIFAVIGTLFWVSMK